MSNAEKILELVQKNNGVVTAAEVTQAGISRGSLKHLVDSGVLEHAARGVYQLAEVWDDEMYQLQIRYKKGIFSGETALFLSDLTDRTPIRFHMTFPLKYNIGVLKKENVKCNRTKPEWYELGVIRLKTPAGNLVNAYCMEKTLCDILRIQNDVDIQVVSDAFKRYAKRLDKNIPLLSEYAENLHVEKRLRAYLEVLL
ncbi:MAG: AbiEi antitoxin N-terminal domain-containing protein [Lachnospiraceae bacterium]